MKQMSISICIPAYNEEANIQLLLSDLMSQRMKNAVINQIIVASDGSTDNTTQLIRNAFGKKVKVLEERSRKGIAFTQNHLLAEATGDICVLLNADIRIFDHRFIEKLVNPIVHKNADFSSASICEFSSRTWFEEILLISMQLKEKLFLYWKKANNIYTCHGPARAFRKNLYKTIHFPIDGGEDMYSYLFSVSHSYTYKYVKEAKVYYRLPYSFFDHLKQSTRYMNAKNEYIKFFLPRLVNEEMNIPIWIYIKVARRNTIFLIKNFPMLTLYLFVLLLVNIIFFIRKNQCQTWDVASSKTLPAKI